MKILKHHLCIQFKICLRIKNIIHSSSYCPNGTVNAILYLSHSLICICQNLDLCQILKIVLLDTTFLTNPFC